MEADEFRVTYWPEGSPGSLKEINDIITYHTDNNTFTIPWRVPDELGPTRIAVRNELRPELADTTEVFHVSGRLKVSKPNGDAGEPDFHSLEPILVEWSTVGSVTNVNLFYKYGGGAWQQVNATPIANNGQGSNELYTTTEWIAPDIITDSMLFRVQDANYSEGFDASVRFGYAGTLPVIGDFDGDGIADYGCYDAAGIPGVVAPGSWYFMKSRDGFATGDLGHEGTVPVGGTPDEQSHTAQP